MTAHGLPQKFLTETALTYDGDECLQWPFNRNDQGYGMIWYGRRGISVTRIVCADTHGAPPSPKHHAAHSCGRGHEGCVTRRHLSWKTPAENAADRVVHGTLLRGERHGGAKLKEDEVRTIRQMMADGARLADVAARFSIAKQTVCGIRSRIIWSWLQDEPGKEAS